MTCSRAPTIDRNVLFSYKTGLKISKKGSFFGTGRNGRSARRGIVRGGECSLFPSGATLRKGVK